jgi:hypothetical protein
MAIRGIIPATRIYIWLGARYSLTTLCEKGVLDRDVNDKGKAETHRFSLEKLLSSDICLSIEKLSFVYDANLSSGLRVSMKIQRKY